MPTSLWTTPDAPDASTPEPPAPPRRPGRDLPPPQRPGRRGPGWAALVAAGVIGGGLSLGVGAATGVVGDSSTTTVVRGAPGAVGTSVAASTSTGSSGGLDAGALFASATPGVVDISSRTTAGGGSPASPFGGGGQGRSGVATASGTGFVVDRGGHIVTAAHVVENASRITVTFGDGTKRAARVLGRDEATDVAVLAVNPSGLTLHPLKLGRSSALKIGTPVAAIGDPFNYDRSLSTGIVSGVDRTVGAPNGFSVAHAIQTDAAVNPGNSGGPLLTADGAVVGIVDQIATGGSGADQSSGVGFAIPSDVVSRELGDLIAGRSVRHAYAGVSTADATGTTAGALVGAVSPGGPTAAAGVRAGDIITEVDGKAIGGTSGLVAAVVDHHPGDRLSLTVKRGGAAKTVTVRLGTQPASRTAAGG